MKDPTTLGSRVCLGFKWAAALTWAVPVAGAGIALTATFVGAPIGIPLIWLGCWPLVHVVQKRTVVMAKWTHRDRPLDDQGVPPWEQDWR